MSATKAPAATKAAMKAPAAAKAPAKAREPVLLTEASVAAAASKASGGAAAGEPRRPPGRPSLKPPPPTIEFHGVVDSPKDPSQLLELAHADPGVFKSLFAYFKNLGALVIQVRCTRQGMTFFTRNHGNSSRIIAQVFGDKVNWYYCEREFWFALNRTNVEKMFNSINRSIRKISIRVAKDDTSRVTFVLKNYELNKEQTYRHTTSVYTEDPDLVEAEQELEPEELEQYPVVFTLQASDFKQSIADASNYSDVITIEKLGDSPLCFTYEKSGINYVECYRDDAKINLQSTVAAHEVFRCTIQIANVKSLSASMVAEKVKIYCRNDGDILFRSVFDEGADSSSALICSTLTRIG